MRSIIRSVPLPDWNKRPQPIVYDLAEGASLDDADPVVVFVDGKGHFIACGSRVSVRSTRKATSTTQIGGKMRTALIAAATATIVAGCTEKSFDIKEARDAVKAADCCCGCAVTPSRFVPMKAAS